MLTSMCLTFQISEGHLRYVFALLNSLNQLMYRQTAWNGITKCGNLSYAITYNLIRANQMTESFEYLSLVTRSCNVWHANFPAILSGIGRLFKFCQCVNSKYHFIINWCIPKKLCLSGDKHFRGKWVYCSMCSWDVNIYM